MTVIYILWLRQIKRYFRSRARILGSLGQPILYLLALGYGFGSVFQRAGQGNYINFLVPGVIAMSIIFTAIFSGVEIIWDRQFGFLKETLVAPVSRVSIMFGRTLGGATVATLQGTIVFIISLFFGFKLPSANLILAALGFMIITALLFTALGTAIASVLEDIQGFQLIMNFLVLPLYFLSGALFPIQGLPKLMSFLVKIDPLSYGVDGLRGALIHLNHFTLGQDYLILGIITIFFIVLGSYLFTKIQI